MTRFTWDILCFLLANAVGFLAANFWYVIGVKIGAFPIGQENFDVMIIKDFFNKTVLIWLACAVFSLIAFLLRGWVRYVFLLAPAIVPMLYGFSVLFLR